MILLIVCHVATDLREDQFHQLMQRLLGGHPGVEHGGYVLDIRLKGTRWGTQVTEDVWDDISQGRLTVVVFTVIVIKRLVLRRNQREKNNWKTKCLYSVRNPSYLLYNWKRNRIRLWHCSEGEDSTYFILAHSSGDKLWGAGRKLRRLGDGIHGGRCAAAIGILQGFVWFFHI